jgi:hypothetical protein
MKVRISAVKQFIAETIERLRVEHEKKFAEASKEYSEEYVEWDRLYGSKWDAALRKATRARRLDNPITYEMFPPRIGTSTYHDPKLATMKPLKSEEFEVPSDLAGMSEFCDVLVDEEVDARSLSIPDIRELFQTYAVGKKRRRR